ncbi:MULTISPECIES: outer membrane protein assembly factor BamB [unclassified Acinetobacter]|uniref:outer membrane protein assembly factor BamB n=1 Tax=unclassified Acinetobacter TaxID=196816 RepID=UPI002934EAD9|nr:MULTISPECIES: outer membrane protein assembly factor BamB [unclassified Acinetobacter]WOE30423.1 outer membrane protein assembly factor BamB [Acinetobacter sp. SAAs470]WOE38614.1 outer membrane protein assembly factor BamB [Acinetobacter sp. SAAs474]
MNRKFRIPFALTVLTLALVGCSSNKIKVEEVKPNPLPKLEQSVTLSPIFSQSVSATSEKDPLRLQADAVNGIIFIADPKGKVIAYQGKQKLWEKQVSKLGLSSGVKAADGIVIVGNKKGQLFALDQATGEEKWVAQLSGAILAPSLVMANRVITLSNDGTVFANNVSDGKQIWSYNLPNVPLSLRGTASPVAVDERAVAIAYANAYIYILDSLTGTPLMQRRVAISEGRSDIQRLNDINGDPVAVANLLITTSYQGQVTALDLNSQKIIWSEKLSSTKRPEVVGNGVFVAAADGQVVAYEINSGRKLWENNDLLHRQLSNPVMLGDDLIVGDLDGYLHLINPSTGQLIGRAKTSGAVRSLRVIDQQLYVDTQKGAVSIWQKR